MPLQYAITVDDRAVRKTFERISKAGRNPRPVLAQAGEFGRRSAQRRLRNLPARRRGFGRSHRLEKSITRKLEEFTVIWGSNLPYALMRQRGGVIKPKTVKALAIPMQAHLARREIWPRDLPKDTIRYVPARRKGGIVAYLFRAKKETYSYTVTSGPHKGETRTKTRGKVGELLYILVKKTRIKGFAYLIFGAEERAFTLRVARQHIERAIKGG